MKLSFTPRELGINGRIILKGMLRK